MFLLGWGMRRVKSVSWGSNQEGRGGVESRESSRCDDDVQGAQAIRDP